MTQPKKRRLRRTGKKVGEEAADNAVDSAMEGCGCGCCLSDLFFVGLAAGTVSVWRRRRR
jgi:hypothetical protein